MRKRITVCGGKKNSLGRDKEVQLRFKCVRLTWLICTADTGAAQTEEWLGELGSDLQGPIESCCFFRVATIFWATEMTKKWKRSGGIYALWRKTYSKKTVAVNTAAVQSVVRRVKWFTSLPLMRVCMESLTQAAPNSPITLLRRPALGPLSKPPRPIISTFSLPRPFLFSLDALPAPGKGRRQSIARLCRYRSVDGPRGNLRPARGEMFYRFVISRLTTLIPSCGEKLTEKSSFFNP